jgi:4-carboxymuconolactone decarboxylase
MMPSGEWRCMGRTARFQETLRRLAMIDEGFVEDEAGLALNQAAASALDPKTVALLRIGASVAIGSSAACLEWSAGRALAAGASEDEIADVLLAVIPVIGLGRVASAAPDLATALGYDVSAVLTSARIESAGPGVGPEAPGLPRPGRERPAETHPPGLQLLLICILRRRGAANIMPSV